MTNPWIAEATVLKLYPDRLAIAINERRPFALWQKDGRVERDRRRRHRARNLCAAHAMPACRWWSAPAPRRAPSEFLALLDRYPGAARQGARRGAGRRAALEPAAQKRRRSAAAGIRSRQRRSSSSSSSTATRNCSSRDIVVVDLRLARPRDRAACPTRRPQARDEALKKKQQKKKGGNA